MQTGFGYKSRLNMCESLIRRKFDSELPCFPKCYFFATWFPSSSSHPPFYILSGLLTTTRLIVWILAAIVPTSPRLAPLLRPPPRSPHFTSPPTWRYVT
eukprot:766611-Hanusia_phi.AAC.4